MTTKTPSYRITTADDSLVDNRTERPAAIKRADKLTEQTGLVHRVYTPGGKLVHETEVIEPAPADEVPSVDITEAEEVTPEASPIVVREMTIVDVEDEDDVEDSDEDDEDASEETVAPVTEEPSAPIVVREMTVVDVEDDDVEDEPEAEEADEDAPEEEAEEATEAGEFVSYATVMDQLKAKDEALRTAAKTEWERRLEIYRAATNAKDTSKRIVGPGMAAALERGATTDGRTRAALIRRGLVEPGDDLAFTINEAGRAALAAAIAAAV